MAKYCPKLIKFCVKAKLLSVIIGKFKIVIKNSTVFKGKKNKRKTKLFLSKIKNVKVDFLAVLPYFISALVESLEDLQILGKAGKIMRLVRVMRILRIFKLVRHFAGLQSLLYTLKQAYKELGLLIILVNISIWKLVNYFSTNSREQKFFKLKKNVLFEG